MNSLTKSTILTILGYIIGSISQFIIYPVFGLTVSLSNVLTLGLIFTAVAFVSNFIGLKIISFIEKKLDYYTLIKLKGIE